MSRSTMRFHPLLHVFILQCLWNLAHGQLTSCDTVLLVRRQTTYRASPGEALTIKCPAKFCNNSLPLISWIKHVDGHHFPMNMSHRVYTDQTVSNSLEGEWYLIFKEAQTGDSGSYQCQVGETQSHVIYVNVSGHAAPPTATTEDITAGLEVKEDSHISVYLYFFLGVLVCAVILMSMICSFKKM